MDIRAMCGRYRTKHDPLPGWADIRITPDVDRVFPLLFEEQNDDVRPGEVHPILIGGDSIRVEHATWGFKPTWARARPYVNARAETLFTNALFREAGRLRRCVIGTTGFYEWRKVPGAKKVRQLIERRDGKPLFLAGVWEPSHGSEPPTYAVITCDANTLIRPIHERMPVILEADAIEPWLTQDTKRERLDDLLEPPENDVLVVTPHPDVKR